MTRGKAAAQAANRRLGEAVERIAVLEQQLADRTAAHRTEVEQLRADLARARGATSREVARLAKESIAAANTDARATIIEAARAAREDHIRKVIDGLTMVSEKVAGGPRSLRVINVEAWAAIAAAFDIPPDRLNAEGPPRAANRALRREEKFRFTERTHILEREIQTGQWKPND